jgi:hypothetical protein
MSQDYRELVQQNRDYEVTGVEKIWTGKSGREDLDGPGSPPSLITRVE